jgi:hypothetical protein
MSFPENVVATGRLFEPYGPDVAAPDDWNALDRDVHEERGPRPGWFEITYRSLSPIVDSQPDEEGRYSYYYLLRRSGHRFLLVSSHVDLVKKLVDLLGLRDRIFSPSVKIAQLVNDLVAQPCEYCMSALYANVNGYGQALDSISLYGADLADAELFTGLLPQLLPYRVTLRDVKTKHEMLSAGSMGQIGFHYNGGRSLRSVDETLAFLSKHNYLKWGD